MIAVAGAIIGSILLFVGGLALIVTFYGAIIGGLAFGVYAAFKGLAAMFGL